MRAWVYKVNPKRPGKFTGWHFDEYFRSRGRQPYDMGGREWIRSPQSWARLRRVRRGDLFVCYQSDERKVYGLARAASPGYESLPGSGIFDSVDFEPRGLRLANPVDVRSSRPRPQQSPKTKSSGSSRAQPRDEPAARELFRHLRAFTVPSRGTIHRLARDELRALLRTLAAFNPTQRQAITAFLGERRI